MSVALGNQLVQSQQMTLTPKMIEELRILHMSNIELMQYIDEALVENPLLETDKADDLIDTLLNSESKYIKNGDSISMDDDQSKKDFIESIPTFISLKQHLLSQIGELKIDLKLQRMAEQIIYAIDEDGYFRESIDEVAAAFRIPAQRMLEALKLVQDLEPAGIGARNLKECILLQLKRKNLLNSINKRIVLECLDLLGMKKYNAITKKLNISVEQIIRVHEMIRLLTPKPGLQFYDSRISYIAPELLVKEIDGRFIIIFLDEKVPVLKINDFYKGLVKKEECNTETYKYIKTKMSKAVEIIRAIEQRKRTILSTADFIIQYQEDFLRKGRSHLKPLTMRMVADGIGVHESTISRTVNNKYIQTPNGIFELKHFFSGKIESDKGSSFSVKSIKEAIRKVVSDENKGSPLSDEQIRKVLEEKGMKLARRTVAKYREALLIFPARMRK